MAAGKGRPVGAVVHVACDVFVPVIQYFWLDYFLRAVHDERRKEKKKKRYDCVGWLHTLAITFISALVAISSATADTEVIVACLRESAARGASSSVTTQRRFPACTIVYYCSSIEIDHRKRHYSTHLISK